MSDTCINLRGSATDSGFRNGVRDVLGQELPLEPNTTTEGAHCVYWLGPDEWLVFTAIEQRDELVAKLESALTSIHASVNDQTDGNVVIRLAGADVVDVLAQGCTLDFEELGDGDCAQTGLGKSGILLRRNSSNDYTIIVRRSFADYLRRWLEHAAGAREIEFR